MTQAEAARYAQLLIEALSTNQGIRNPAAAIECLSILSNAILSKSKKG